MAAFVLLRAETRSGNLRFLLDIAAEWRESDPLLDGEFDLVDPVALAGAQPPLARLINFVTELKVMGEFDSGAAVRFMLGSPVSMTSVLTILLLAFVLVCLTIRACMFDTA